MDEPIARRAETNQNAMIAFVLALGIGSVLFSFALNNYVGMVLAIVALSLTHFSLTKIPRSTWCWCFGLPFTGFALGFAALLMRMIVDALRG